MVVKVGEEDDEGDGVTNQSPLHPGRERAATVERVAGVANGHMELDLKMEKRAEIKTRIALHVNAKHLYVTNVTLFSNSLTPHTYKNKTLPKQQDFISKSRTATNFLKFLKHPLRTQKNNQPFE